MEQLKEVSQNLNGCFSSIQDALDALELMKEQGALSEEIYEAVSERIFNVLDELNSSDEFIQKLSECKSEDEIETLINVGME